ncbi:YdcH family protein [Psychrosphaera haliotis]|uniref:DUF465 domain-containing protein n=1 Tax=Psychrosphaera haliotis TaxID=555083 RepID=A0A6N8F861_9GAMM|nr:YdcH family protein [Psychrosphaera haliotis]MUH71267.1 DUF465 domain-containing protein [Psychrosphaera haliotis]
MLGEDHSLVNEFPDHKDKIIELNNADADFAAGAKRYHSLDSEIRNLELKNAPIDDETFHQMKQERAQLKDRLYKILTSK